MTTIDKDQFNFISSVVAKKDIREYLKYPGVVDLNGAPILVGADGHRMHWVVLPEDPGFRGPCLAVKASSKLVQLVQLVPVEKDPGQYPDIAQVIPSETSEAKFLQGDCRVDSWFSCFVFALARETAGSPYCYNIKYLRDATRYLMSTWVQQTKTGMPSVWLRSDDAYPVNALIMPQKA